MEDLIRFLGDQPDPFSDPPEIYFSGGGVSYIESLLNFLRPREFFLEVSKKGTRFIELDIMSYRPGTKGMPTSAPDWY